MVDIYLTASRLGKYPPLAADTEVNTCFSIYSNSEINIAQKDDFSGAPRAPKGRAHENTGNPFGKIAMTSFSVRTSVRPFMYANVTSTRNHITGSSLELIQEAILHLTL